MYTYKNLIPGHQLQINMIDFNAGLITFFDWGEVLYKTPPVSVVIDLNKSLVAIYEVASEIKQKHSSSFTKKVVGGTVGGLFLGVPGLLAGALAVGDKTTTTEKHYYSLVLRSGESFIFQLEKFQLFPLLKIATRNSVAPAPADYVEVMLLDDWQRQHGIVPESEKKARKAAEKKARQERKAQKIEEKAKQLEEEARELGYESWDEVPIYKRYPIATRCVKLLFGLIAGWFILALLIGLIAVITGRMSLY